MSARRRVKGWWVICLMAGLGAQPLWAAQAGDVSRAVEVAPPKGWTPDTPLFREEPTTSGREAAPAATKEAGGHAPPATRAARRLDAAGGDAAASVRRTRVRGLAERSAADAREPAPKVAKASRAQPRQIRATDGQGAPLKASRATKARARAKTKANAKAKSAALASTPSPRSETAPAATKPAATAKAQRANATALAPRRSAASRKGTIQAGNQQARAGKSSQQRSTLHQAQASSRQVAKDKGKGKARPPAGGRAIDQRVKRG